MSASARIQLALGHRAGRRDGWRGGVHRIGLLFAAAALVFTSWLAVGIDALHSRGEERVAARAPVFTDDPAAAVAQWTERPDTLGTYQYLVIYVQQLRPDAPPPPGLPRWPKPGEAFLSPALVGMDPSGDIARRYGAFGGEIDLSGLSEPRELLVYATPVVPDAFASANRRALVSGFGAGGAAARSVLPGGRSVSDAYLMLLFFGGLPVLALIVVAGTSEAEGRDRRVAMLRSLGAGPGARVLVILGEALLPTVTGALCGAVLGLATTVADVRLPATGYTLVAADLAERRLWLPVLALAAAAVVTLLAVAAAITVRGTSRPRTVRARPPRPAFLALFAGGLLLAAYGSSVRGEWGRTAYLIGLLAALASAPSIAVRVALTLGEFVARIGAARGWPSATVGGRWLTARPGTLARVTAGALIGLGLLVQAQVMTTQLSEPERAARFEAAQLADAAVLVRTVGGARDADRLRSAFGADRVIEGWAATDGGLVAVGDCVALAGLSREAACSSTPVPLAERGGLTAAGRVLSYGTVVSGGSLSTATARPGGEAALQGVFVLNPSGPAGVEEIKRLAQATTAMPVVRTPAEGMLGGLASRARLAWWIYDFGLLALMLLAAAAGVGVAGAFVTQAHGVGAIASYTGGGRFLARIAVWNLVLPATAVTLLGAVAAAVLGGLLIRLGNSGTFSVGILLAAVLSVLAVALVAAVIATAVTVRMAATWRPAGD